ncbi:MAG: hypothetical protein ACK56J_12955 [Planctomycetota bacterium]
MAKRKKNKSLAIREHYEQFPSDKPKAISEALKSKGITAGPAYISMILSKLRKAGDGAAAEGAGEAAPQKKRRGRPAGSGKKAAAAKSTAVAKSATGRFGFEELKLAKQLVSQMGNANAAKQLLDALV